MSRRYEELKTPLQEFLQLDKPDLALAVYRVMPARRAEKEEAGAKMATSREAPE